MTMGSDVGRIGEGMVVKSVDGERLGKVLSVGAGEFYIEKGTFFTKDYAVSLSDVQAVQGDEVILRTGREALRRVDQSEIISAGATNADTPLTQAPTPTAYTAPTAQAEQRMPLAEEQVEVGKHERDVGEVRIGKEVVEETQTFTVPVRKEQVRVERVPASEAAMSASSGAAFNEDEELRIPIREEQLEIHKREVITGEVRAAKESHEEEERVTESVRREEPRVYGDADVRTAPGISDRDPDKRS
jgi:uncharacterized protein (TIGR02271 family)